MKAKSPGEDCRYDRKEDRKYIDELITKQASEIAELRNEIRQLNCNHKEKITEIERQATADERKSVQTIAMLESDLKSKEERYNAQVEMVCYKYFFHNFKLYLIFKRVANASFMTLLKYTFLYFY